MGVDFASHIRIGRTCTGSLSSCLLESQICRCECCCSAFNELAGLGKRFGLSSACVLWLDGHPVISWKRGSRAETTVSTCASSCTSPGRWMAIHVLIIIYLIHRSPCVMIIVVHGFVFADTFINTVDNFRGVVGCRDKNQYKYQHVFIVQRESTFFVFLDSRRA